MTQGYANVQDKHEAELQGVQRGIPAGVDRKANRPWTLITELDEPALLPKSVSSGDTDESKQAES